VPLPFFISDILENVYLLGVKEVFAVHILSVAMSMQAKAEEESPCTSQPLSLRLSDWRAGSRKRRNVLWRCGRCG
jgi:hypothetical protein